MKNCPQKNNRIAGEIPKQVYVIAYALLLMAFSFIFYRGHFQADGLNAKSRTELMHKEDIPVS